MKQIFDVFAFTFKTGAKKKAFIIITVIMAVIVLAVCSVPRILIAFTGGDLDSIGNTAYYTCYIVDETNMFDGCENELTASVHDVNFTSGSKASLKELTEMVKNNSKYALIHIVNNNNGIPTASLFAKDFLNGVVSNAETVNDVLSGVYSRKVLSDANIETDVIDASQIKITCELTTLGGITVSGYAVGLVLIMLTFFAVYYYGYGVSASIASEKSSRVMETLVVSVKPYRILIGKCLGMGILGLTQFGGILLFGAVCAKLLIPADFSVFGETISFAAFDPLSVFLILIYFVLGYMLYAFMNAVSGASVDKIEDLNTAMMPVMLISMASFYLSYFTAIMGTTYDYMVKIAMYIPFSAPFIMPFVLLNGEVSALDIILSLAILSVTIIVVIIISVRIYTASVMHYGKRLKFKDALKKH